jgi:hypothetical protein
MNTVRVTDLLSGTEAPPVRRRSWSSILLRLVVVAALLMWSAYVWSGPRSQVPVPGPQAEPVEVVEAYLTALDQRDFDTVNAIEDMGDEDLGRFSRPVHFSNTNQMHATRDGHGAHVTFLCDISGDASISGDQDWWGFYLERGKGGRWYITDAGVA